MRAVAFAGQRAAPPGEWVIWDYHVIFLVKEQGWVVWDPDARVGLSTPLFQWLNHAFPPSIELPHEHQPWFRVVEGEAFLNLFRSDRSHMRNIHGGGSRHPNGSTVESTNLMKFVGIRDFHGEVYSQRISKHTSSAL